MKTQQPVATLQLKIKNAKCKILNSEFERSDLRWISFLYPTYEISGLLPVNLTI